MDRYTRELQARSYFFDKGICFECTRCGACCTGEPGIIYVDEHEITQISEFLEISRDVFESRCLYPFQDSYSIREADDGRCIFFENGCSIYPVRPVQCRTFPFWFQNMRSEKAWREVSFRCPGIGRGPRYSKASILESIGLSFHIYENVMKEIMGKK